MGGCDQCSPTVTGIHLRQKDETTLYAIFSYCPAPFMDAPVRVDWKILTPEAIVSEHICFHKLQHSDNLAELLSHCDSQYTKALFIVNYEDDFTLPQEVLQGEFPQPSFPVCVLSSQEGQQLLRMVEAHDVGDLLARVEATSLSDSQAKSSKSPSPDDLSLSLQNGMCTGCVGDWLVTVGIGKACILSIVLSNDSYSYTMVFQNIIINNSRARGNWDCLLLYVFNIILYICFQRACMYILITHVTVPDEQVCPIKESHSGSNSQPTHTLPQTTT